MTERSTFRGSATIRASDKRARGFTLLEAMVALVIVALGMMAVNTQLNRYAVAAGFVETKTLASWIASNIITTLSVGPEWPDVGDREEDLEFAGRMWHCAIVVSETDVENLHRVDVSVSLADDPERVVHKVSGLIEPPAPAGFQPLEWTAPPTAEQAEGEDGRPSSSGSERSGFGGSERSGFGGSGRPRASGGERG